MATRRNRPRYGAADVLNAALYGPLLWPGRTVRLERNSMLDYRNRPTSSQISVAELYHENSKLSVEMLPELVFTSVSPTELRGEFLRRRAALARTAAADQFDGAKLWRDLLDAVGAQYLDLFYAIEVRVVSGNVVAAYEPAGSVFQLIGRLDGPQRARLESSLWLGSAGDGPGDAESLLFLVAVFPRNEILYGQRGYRRTLIEAGQIAEAVLRRAAQTGHRATVRHEFADRDIDLIMEADGVEQSTVLAIAFG
ncbi:MAG TPA: hypothetical protein VGQ24_02795 [Gemmatimonadales bacterium]|jgi:hypothetical protein|nr:hypothetical protein [Gemmatimonadales bacterium]